MRVAQWVMQAGQSAPAWSDVAAIHPDVVLVFADVALMRQSELWADLQTRLGPDTALLGCSTAGEIIGAGSQEGGAVVTAIKFGASRVKLATETVASAQGSWQAGQALARQLKGPGLSAVMVYAPGADINGAALADGLYATLGHDVPVIGGLAGDAGAFTGSLQMAQGQVDDRLMVAVGLYGDKLKLGYGSYGGWLPYGLTMTATQVQDQVLREIDGRPALAVYKELLGPLSRALPQAGMLYPFEVLDADSDGPVSSTNNSFIRTILGVDEAQQTLTLAGAVAPNSRLRLMQSSQSRLVNGATLAANQAHKMWQPDNPVPSQALALLVSCVGRRMVLGDHVDEELRAVSSVLRNAVSMAGFYSNGELAPGHKGGACLLHNQTMTLALLSEA